MMPALFAFKLEMKLFALAWLVSLNLGVSGKSQLLSKPCRQHEFPCGDGTCIDVSRWCDRALDCSSRIDEMYCFVKANRTHTRVCPPDMFQCTEEGCIPKNGICDGFKSCKDGSDEANCVRVSVPVADEGSFSEPDHHPDEEANARNWLFARRQDFAWGEDTERAVVALSLSPDSMGDFLEEELTIKTLHLRIALALANNLHSYSLSQRALFINAVRASCGDPRRFHGVDLVADLRGSLDMVLRGHAQSFVSPLVYFTLCLHNASAPNDMNQLRRDMERTDIFGFRNGLKAYILFTAVCAMEKGSRQSEALDVKRRLVEELSQSDPENIYELALVTQALNAARVNPVSWNRQEKMKSILNLQLTDGSFGDMLATYYVMPLLSGKSLLDLGANCERNDPHNESTTFEILRNKSERINVNYTLNFGAQKKISQTMFLSVRRGSTILDLMQSAQGKNENFRFGLDQRKPTVYTIGGMPNDAERGLYWKAYTNRGGYKSLITDIKAYLLSEGESITFSMESL